MSQVPSTAQSVFVEPLGGPAETAPKELTEAGRKRRQELDMMLAKKEVEMDAYRLLCRGVYEDENVPVPERFLENAAPAPHNPDITMVGVKTVLKNASVFPGGIVEGYVQIQAPRPVGFSAARLQLVGEEKVDMYKTVTHTDESLLTGISNTRTTTITKTFLRDDDASVFHCHVITLAGADATSSDPYKHEEQRTMAAGNYTYPFAIQLPENLPPSIEFERGQGSKKEAVNIVYTLSAGVESFGREQPVGAHRTTFEVLKPMPLSQWEAKPVPKKYQVDVTDCCCIPMHYESNVTVDRTAISFDRPSSLTVTAEVVSHSSSILGLEVRLIHLLKVKTRDDKGKLSNTESPVRRELKMVRNMTNIGSKNPTYQCTVELPEKLIPTVTRSSMIQSTLWLDVFVGFENSCANIPAFCCFPLAVAQAIDVNNCVPPVQAEAPSDKKEIVADPVVHVLYEPPPMSDQPFVPIPQ